jgi:hypothetical protein
MGGKEGTGEGRKEIKGIGGRRGGKVEEVV